MLDFDFVIVGAGTAGCLLANRLSRDAAARVLLIEAGGKDDYHWVHIPVGYLYCIGNPRTDWLYQTEPAAGLNGRTLRYPRGKVLGGCSSINGMLYLRGQSRDYDQWAALTGEDEWRWERCLPDFRAHEDHYRLDAYLPGQRGGPGVDFAALHGNFSTGSSAEWRIEKQRLRWDVLDAFAQAAQQAGIPATDDFNRGNNEGVGYFEVNQRGGWRWNTAKAFLRPALRRPNLTVWTSAQVKRVLVERSEAGLRCTGVELVRGGELVTVRAAREVVLSAGSIGSPQILQLSGIGPAALLRQHGIAVLADLPGVGANLQDHLQIRSVYKVTGGKTLNQLASTPWGKGLIGLDYALRRRGPMSMAPSQLGAFTRSSPEFEWPNIEYHVQPLSLDAFCEPLHTFPAITAASATSTRPAAAACRSGARASRTRPRSRPTTWPRRKTARSPPTACASRAASWRSRPWRASSRRNSSPARSTRATRSWRAWPATSPAPSSIRSAPPGWGGATTRWRC